MIDATEPEMDRYGKPTAGEKLCPHCGCVLSTSTYLPPDYAPSKCEPYCSNFACSECWAHRTPGIVSP